MTLLRVESLTVHYGKAQVLTDVNIEVRAGESVAIIGPNGAGKTTLFRAISGLVRPTRGTIYFKNEPISHLPPYEIVGLGLIHAPERRRLAPRMTVLENLMVGAYRRSDRNGIRHDLERVYAMFPILEKRAEQLAGTLSGGEQQMLTVARALMASPEFLLMDEPSLGLAPLIKEQIFQSIAEIQREGVTVLVAEQDASLALPAVSRAYVLESGHVALHGPSENLMANDYVRQTYLGL
ncbi:MAG: ABC transporter ATP-binding protein [Chloroflexi bacterium]|nr:MAG: ABC transporter ATP-binding protein [Chloroflexota bacterium]